MFNKYKYYTGKNTVVAVSSYAGKPVRGIAKCDPRDEFDIEKGKELAAARCNLKVAEKRHIRSINKLIEANKQLNDAIDYFNRMATYEADSSEAVGEAAEILNNVLQTM